MHDPHLEARPRGTSASAQGPARRVGGTKTVLVTGASTGIGRHIAEALHARGHRVLGTSRAPARAPAGHVELLALDVTSAASVGRLMAELDRRGVHLDALVNNAGFDLIGAAEETTDAETEAQLQTNFLGAVRMTRAVLPGMRRRHAGRIVQIGSTGGFLALPFNAAYSASKFALEGYSESLRYELAPWGIDVSVIVPAGVQTEKRATSLRAVATSNPAYAADRAAMRAAFDASVRGGALAPEVVARAIVRVVEGRRPPLRVLVGAQARALQALKTWLPEAWLERFMVARFLAPVDRARRPVRASVAP